MRRRDGRHERIAPASIVADLAGNPVVAIAWPRPDFNGATLEFLIGLLATAFAPKDLDEWLDRWEAPPSPGDLQAAFESIAFAFDLDGDGPRFMQELEPLEDPSQRDIAALLIEQPGEQSLERNADHFVKRGTIAAISRSCAAMALYACQAYSPAGGRGYLTSMRGGGPLTTLITVDSASGPTTIWHTLWPNVLTAEGPDWHAAPSSVFPWLAPTRSSLRFQVTTPEHGHPLQVFWGMPRRVRLLFEPAEGRTCDLGGPSDDMVTIGWQTKQYGVKYEGWRHPLSPYVSRTTDTLPTPVKGNPGGVSYRHWLGLVQVDEESGRHPALCVSTYRRERADAANAAGARLIAFGYDMDNMKARDWCQSEMPVPNVPQARREAFEARAAQLVRAADQAAYFTRSAAKRALFTRPSDVKADFSWLADRFWRDTEAPFFAQLGKLAETSVDDQALREGWLAELRAAALAIFDDIVPSEGLEAGAWKRVIEARQWLARNLDGKKARAALGLGERVERVVGTRAKRRESGNA